jgi:4-hydroxybenzoate polyprenyltransferase
MATASANGTADAKNVKTVNHTAQPHSRIAAILRFTKIEHTAFSLPLIFTGAWMGAGYGWPGWATMALILVAATGARICGMSFNRIFDRHIDARNPRTAGRELPAGIMAVRSALVIGLTGAAVYLASCAALGRWCLILAPVPLVPLMGYSLLKRYTVLCHFGIGLCLALAPIGAFVAAAGHPRLTTEVVLFSEYVFFWLSGADIIYAVLDIDSDRHTGIHSLPASLGRSRSLKVAAMTHLAAMACLLSLLLLMDAGGLAYGAYGITMVCFVLLHLPAMPIGFRFFPMASIAGIAGAVTPMLV